MGVPGKIEITRNSVFDKLGEIAKFAIGSKEVSSAPSAEFKGGAGRIGMINGHVVKFNTHASERLRGPKADQDMRDSCNELRTNLFEIARKLNLGDKTLAGIRSKLGLNRDGSAPQNAKLLDRKVVVSVINLIGKDSNIQKAGIDVWEKMNLRVQEIKDLASTTVDESGKTVKRDMHFEKIKDMSEGTSGKTVKPDTHFGKITSNVNEGMSGKAAKLDAHFASLQRPDENVIVADEEPLVEEQVVEEQVVEEPRGEVRSDKAVAKPPLHVDAFVSNASDKDGFLHSDAIGTIASTGSATASEEKEVKDVQPEVKPEVKDVLDAKRAVLTKLKELEAEYVVDNSANGLFDAYKNDFFRMSRTGIFTLTANQADEIIKKQIADGTKFGQALKKQREDPSGFKPGDDLDSINQSLATAIKKYLAYGDVTETLGRGKETTAVKVCKDLLARASEPFGPNFGIATNLRVYIRLMNVVPPELTRGEADAIVKYLVDAMTDLGLDLEKVKNGDETVKKEFVDEIKKSYSGSATGKKCLWDAILGYVGIDPKQMGSGNNGSGEVGKKGDVNQGADSKWTIEDLRTVSFLGADDTSSPVCYTALNSGIREICKKINDAGVELTDEMADAIINDQVQDEKKTRFGKILDAIKDDKSVTSAGGSVKLALLEILAGKPEFNGGNLGVFRKAVLKYVGGEEKKPNIQG